jgi:4'-phosphopantetheinyl transferase
VPVVTARDRAPGPSTASPARPSNPVVRLLSLHVEGGALAEARALLTSEERAHADRGIPPVARRRIVLRAALRRLAGEVLGLSPASVPIRTGRHGRPELDVPGVDLSCSRSDEHGLVAVSFGLRIGVDIERIAAWDDAVLDEPWLSENERRALSVLTRTPGAIAVTRCWTRKEAVLKGIGTGLLRTAADIAVGVAAGPVSVGSWRVDDLPAPEGHLASIATRPDPDLPAITHPAASAVPERSSRGHDRA